MRTIQIPENCKIDDLSWAVYMAAKYAFNKGHDALGNVRMDLSVEIDRLNPDEVELTEVGATCDCDQRDADEIPVYLKAFELGALATYLERTTFGDLDDSDNVNHLHRAIKEVIETTDRHLLEAMGLNS